MYDALIAFIHEHNEQLSVGGTLLAAIAATFSSIVAIVSVVAAFSSASSAHQANKTAMEAERRLSIRTTLADAHAILIECDRIHRLAVELKLNYQSLAVFNGVSGGSRDQIHQKAAYEHYEYAKKLSQSAVELTAQPRLLDHIEVQFLDMKQVEIAAVLMELVALREHMIDELNNIRLQNSDARNAKVRQ